MVAAHKLFEKTKALIKAEKKVKREQRRAEIKPLEQRRERTLEESKMQRTQRLANMTEDEIANMFARRLEFRRSQRLREERVMTEKMRSTREMLEELRAGKEVAEVVR